VSVGAHEFRNRFGYYMECAAGGAEVAISRHGRPYVRLVPAIPSLTHPLPMNDRVAGRAQAPIGAPPPGAPPS